MWCDTIYNIIWMSCLSVLFVVAEPIIMMKRNLGFREEDICGVQPVRDFFTKLLYCAMCSGFWIGLILSFDPQKAVIVSILSELIYRKIMK